MIILCINNTIRKVYILKCTTVLNDYFFPNCFFESFFFFCKNIYSSETNSS